MNNIKLKDFDLERFDYDNIEHSKIINKFDFDKEINKYIISSSDSFSEIIDYYRLSNPESIYNKLYLVKNTNNEIIGEIEFDGNENDLYLNYSILKQYRNNGYCTKLLLETTKFLLEDIKTISLLIKEENVKSKNVATKSGFSMVSHQSCGYLKYQINA